MSQAFGTGFHKQGPDIPGLGVADGECHDPATGLYHPATAAFLDLTSNVVVINDTAWQGVFANGIADT